jgi:hypothetical protein
VSLSTWCGTVGRLGMAEYHSKSRHYHFKLMVDSGTTSTEIGSVSILKRPGSLMILFVPDVCLCLCLCLVISRYGNAASISEVR